MTIDCNRLVNENLTSRQITAAIDCNRLMTEVLKGVIGRRETMEIDGSKKSAHKTMDKDQVLLFLVFYEK